MASRGDRMDVLESLARMKPDLDELGRSWSAGQRDVIIDDVLSGGPKRGNGVPVVRWMAVAAAVTTAALLVVPSALGPSRPVPAVPIGPSPAPASTPAAPDATARATLDFSVHDPSDLAFPEIQATLTRVAGSLSLDIAAGEGADRVVRSYPVDRDGFWSAEVAPGLVVALVPGPASSLMTRGDRPAQLDAIDSRLLREFDRTLVAIQRDEASEGFDGLIWQDAGRNVRNSLDQLVPSAHLEFPSSGDNPAGTVTVFLDDGLQVWGYIDTMNGHWGAAPLNTAPVGAIAGLGATSVGDYFYNTHDVGLLPTGGTDPEFTFTQAGTFSTSAPVGDTGQTAFLVVVDKIRHGDPPIESITYTDPAGKRLSYDPSAASDTKD